jgi:hypothetical protein
MLDRLRVLEGAAPCVEEREERRIECEIAVLTSLRCLIQIARDHRSITMPPSDPSHTTAPPCWLCVNVAFLVANAVTLAALLYKYRAMKPSQLNGSNATVSSAVGTLPSHEEVEDDAATEAFANIEDNDEEETTVANSPPGAAHSQTFRTSHTIHAGKPRERKLSRTVYCMDTNAYLHSIPIPPTAVAAAPADKPNTAAAVVESSSSSHAAPVSSHPWSHCSVITSVPDVSETGLSLPKWRAWFRHISYKILQRLDEDQVAIFYQTDIRTEGQWVSKAFLVMEAAQQAGLKLVWHKIVLVNTVNTIRGSTASFVNLLCFSKAHKENLQSLTPDVLAHRGTMLWKRAMGLRACEFACRYITTHVPTATGIIDPFCGSGSTLSMANHFGLHSLGVDHCRKRCTQASTLDVAELDGWGGDGGASEKEKQWEADKQEALATRKAERAASGRTQKEQQLYEKERKRREREEKALEKRAEEALGEE